MAVRSKVRVILNRMQAVDDNLLTMVYMCLKENRSLADEMAIVSKAEKLEQKNIFKKLVHQSEALQRGTLG